MVSKKSFTRHSLSSAKSRVSSSAKKLSSTKTRARSTRSSTKTKPLRTRRPLTWREGTLLTIISVSAVCIAYVLILQASFHPELDAKNAIDRLANDYYIEYLYPITLNRNISHPEKVLAAFKHQGLPTTRLRQLLQHNDNQKLKAISNQYYTCDINDTTIRFFPVEPYGPRDYRTEINYACEDLLAE